MTRYYTNLPLRTFIKLEKIALEASISLQNRGDIACRWNDEEDFPEIAITSIQGMLEAAYRLGKEDGEKLGRLEA